jgi:hypothetical protein
MLQMVNDLPEVGYCEGLTTHQREILDEIMDSVFQKMLEDGSIKSIPPKRQYGSSQKAGTLHPSKKIGL